MKRLLMILAAWMLAYTLLVALTPAGTRNYPGGGDAGFYRNTALALVTQGRYSQAPATEVGAPIWGDTIWRPPGYSAWLAGLYALGGDHPLTVRLPQIVLFGLSIALVYLLAWRLVDCRRVALWSALAYACYLPTLVQPLSVLSEALSLPLTLGIVCYAVRTRGQQRLWPAAVLGLLIGLCALVRPQSLLLLPVGLGCLITAGKPHERILRASWCLLLAGATLAPWLIYTTRLTGVPSLGLSGCSQWISAEQYAGRLSYQWTPADWSHLETDWSGKLYRGLALANPRSRVPATIQAELWTDQAWKREARATLHGVSPLVIAKHLPRRLYALWAPAFTAGKLLTWFARGQWVLYAILGCLGAYQYRDRLPAHWPLWLPVLLLSAAHLVLGVEPRYSLPLRPLLLIFVGMGLASLRVPGNWRRTIHPYKGPPPQGLASE